jgi:hypothetical protein
MSAAVVPAISGPPCSESACSRLRLVALTADLELPAREWLVEGMWPDKGVGFIVGPPKSGKSWLALDLAVAACTERDWLGRKVMNPGRVLYFLGEELLTDVAERVMRLLTPRGMDAANLDRRLMISECVPCLEDEANRRLIVQAVKEAEPTLVVFDPLARFLRDADENDSGDMRPITNFARQDLSRSCGVAVCIVHHTPKSGRGARGSGDLRAVSEITLELGESKTDRVKVEVEMRGARPPEPFTVERLEHPESGGLVLRASEGSAGAAIVEKARELLRKAGAEGLTLEAVREALHVRNDRVKDILVAAGAMQQRAKGPFVLRPRSGPDLWVENP